MSLTNLTAFYSEMMGCMGKGRALHNLYLDYSKVFNAISICILTVKYGQVASKMGGRLAEKVITV